MLIRLFVIVVAVSATTVATSPVVQADTCRRVTVYTGAGYDPYVDVCEP